MKHKIEFSESVEITERARPFDPAPIPPIMHQPSLCALGNYVVSEESFLHTIKAVPFYEHIEAKCKIP